MVWDEYAAAYAKLMEHNSLYVAMRSRIHFFSQGFETLLDAGCGPGLILKDAPVPQKYGVDSSTEMIAYARRHVAAQLAIADIHEAQLPHVQATICSNVVYTSSRPSQLVSNISRYTGNRIIITNPNPDADNKKLGTLVLGEFLAKGLNVSHAREIDVFVTCNQQAISSLIHSSLDKGGLCSLLEREQFRVVHSEPIFADEGYLLVADRLQ